MDKAHPVLNILKRAEKTLERLLKSEKEKELDSIEIQACLRELKQEIADLTPTETKEAFRSASQMLKAIKTEK